jgi:hypothetical protein
VRKATADDEQVRLCAALARPRSEAPPAELVQLADGLVRRRALAPAQAA